MLKWTEDNILILYCFLLLNISCVYVGHKISESKHYDEVRSNQKILNNCNGQIRNGMFAKIKVENEI